MKPHHATLAGLFLFAAALATPAPAATDPSFLLTGTTANFDSYFPSYLANGYFSTMTSVRGTEGNRAYMVAFMDYKPGDIARPAAIPGWSEIDYNPGGGWLNSTRIDKKIFADYAQTLDMHDGTLTTSYRFDYANKSTDIKVTTFVSQASNHLAATQLSITPQFDGSVQLTFPIRLWSEHAPRFPIASMTGDEMIAAVIASGQTLDNKPVPTPDRAAVWYPGYTRVLASDGDTKALTLWLDGRAEHGLTMAEAAAIGLPPGLAIESVKLEKGPYKLSLNLVAKVQKGRTYTFTKYIAASRQDWGGDARDDVALAIAARQKGFTALLAEHQAAWHELWKSDIVVDGDPDVQRAVHSDLYYLLSNSTVGTAWPMGACALTPGYAGHAFWDSDSWVFPALLLLHPERAKPIVMFRARTMQPARERAKQYGVKGTMYPWEADPETGVDNTPHFAYGVFREIHVNADIAIAQWQYYLATGDDAWLKQHGWPVIREIAQFWVSRVTYDKGQDRYEIHHVTSPDEAYDDVPNDSFTNAAARKSLQIAIKAAKLVGETPDPQWAAIAAKMTIPFDEKNQRHLDFDASVPHDKITWMGSSLAWLMYPNLDLPMSPQGRRNDFAFQLHELKVHGDDPNEMMMVMLAVGAAELGDDKAAGEWIQRNLVGFLKPPFNVRTETVANNAGYILATSAGFVQSFVYGLSGLRIEDDGLVEAYAPVLPPAWRSLTLKNVAFRGRHYDIRIDRGADGKPRLLREPR
ncbi:glycoside hydrolase family 65 protein [Rhodanobacter sp. B2A1Ga4]|uniref:glycosyl hydrolase family 95 catalytic domain-containing protein n=1 Tax=Rhodanobacter sp. B2A1Ga4 TaxID=2778647 RepID=UPI001B358FA5|nr:glycosyl hydrolase family 65 protein [Rhodanobacter sp. B2A1Ga4]MBQ4854584.1 glycoside hydrolase family 65 protein [Rhodanobacter sp. B2A1Ga4]